MGFLSLRDTGHLRTDASSRPSSGFFFGFIQCAPVSSLTADSRELCARWVPLRCLLSLGLYWGLPLFIPKAAKLCFASFILSRG